MQITTTLNRIKHFEDCKPVVDALLVKSNERHVGDDPIPYSTILDTCGLACTILCCKAEPLHFNVWYSYAVYCLYTVRHLMGSRSLDAVVAAHNNCLSQKTELPQHIKDRACSAAHAAYLTALCKQMNNDSDEELKQARACEAVAIGVLALTQKRVDVAIEAVIEVAAPETLIAIISCFRRVVDSGWLPLVLKERT